jgi:hypothetical protein
MRRATASCEMPAARRLAREIAGELAALGHLGPSGQPYHPGSIAHMLAR